MTDEEKDARMAELQAQVKALEEWKRKITEQLNQPRGNAPIGTPLQGVLSPTAQLAIDRATRPPDRDQLDLVGPIATRVK
jgi:hypothetical protein